MSKFFYFILLIIIIFIFKIDILTYYGKIHVFESEVLPSNSLVVLLGGNLHVRIDKAYTTYKETNAKKILIFKQAKINHEFLKKYVLNETELTQIILKEKYNTNQYEILSLNGNPVRSTYDESRAINNYIIKHNIKNIILITDGFHSNRAYTIFNDVINNNAKIFIKTVSVKGQKYNDWWTTEQGVKYYILELVKFINYYLQGIK